MVGLIFFCPKKVRPAPYPRVRRGPGEITRAPRREGVRFDRGGGRKVIDTLRSGEALLHLQALSNSLFARCKTPFSIK